MLVLLLVGCLTPESFGRQYGVRFCEELEACNGTTPEEAGIDDCETHVDLTDRCPNFDAQAAAACLATKSEEWCNEDTLYPDACAFAVYCPE